LDSWSARAQEAFTLSPLRRMIRRAWYGCDTDDSPQAVRRVGQTRKGSSQHYTLQPGPFASAHQLADMAKPSEEKSSGLFALGGLDYDADPGVAPTEPSLLRGSSPSKPKGGFDSLPGTAVEIQRLADLFRKALPKDEVTLLTGSDPTRARLEKELDARHYRYLHLATHGFFESPERLAAMMAGLRDPNKGLSIDQLGQRADSLAFLPFLKSGLALAGANKGSQKEGQDSGLLTAEGVANLDLKGTELVVLSACETGLGELSSGEGVLGLQRAFHAAGARSLACSLWSVNDAATSVLMEEFYTRLLDKDKPLSKLEALRQAQLFVLKHPEKVIERRKELEKALEAEGRPARPEGEGGAGAARRQPARAGSEPQPRRLVGRLPAVGRPPLGVPGSSEGA
jgi:hypothetical protein